MLFNMDQREQSANLAFDKATDRSYKKTMKCDNPQSEVCILICPIHWTKCSVGQ